MRVFRKAQLTGMLFLVATNLATEVRTASIPWRSSVEEGSAAAKETDKLILVEFWAAWCAPCRTMDAEVYSNDEVATAMSKIVPVRIDFDKKQGVVRKYRIEGVPTVMITDSAGNELFRFVGLLSADTMIRLLRELPDEVTEINRLGQLLARDEKNVAALEAMGQELRAAGLYRASNEYYGKAVRSSGGQEDEARRADMLLAMGLNHLELNEAGEAVKVFEKHLKDFAGTPSEAEAMLGLGHALVRQNKKDKAKQILETLIGRYPSGPIYDQAVQLLRGL
jgi:thioredoxin-like negative regulator of GroEL